MTLYGRDILSIDQFDKPLVQSVFRLARRFETWPRPPLTTNTVLACLFYEPSTRTSSSFIAAMAKLGGSVIPITQGVQFSSVSKGETLEDTVRTLEQYADAIVLRHPEKGAAQRAADVAAVPVINAGDGPGEHPTQALLDLYTIVREHGTNLAGLRVAFVGDLKYGRTVHSLAKLLSTYEARLSFVSPPQLRVPEELRSNGEEHEHLEEVIQEADVIYMTRVQKERFPDEQEYLNVKDSCLLSEDLLAKSKDKTMVMHPLPRLNEIPTSLDASPKSVYFQQVRNGLFVRMALLAMVLNKEMGS